MKIFSVSTLTENKNLRELVENRIDYLKHIKLTIGDKLDESELIGLQLLLEESKK